MEAGPDESIFEEDPEGSIIELLPLGSLAILPELLIDELWFIGFSAGAFEGSV